MVTVDSTSSQDDYARDRDFWEAAVAISAMCIRKGRMGWAAALGKSLRDFLVVIILGCQGREVGLLLGLQDDSTVCISWLKTVIAVKLVLHRFTLILVSSAHIAFIVQPYSAYLAILLRKCFDCEWDIHLLT